MSVSPLAVKVTQISSRQESSIGDDDAASTGRYSLYTISSMIRVYLNLVDFSKPTTSDALYTEKRAKLLNSTYVDLNPSTYNDFTEKLKKNAIDKCDCSILGLSFNSGTLISPAFIAVGIFRGGGAPDYAGGGGGDDGGGGDGSGDDDAQTNKNSEKRVGMDSGETLAVIGIIAAILYVLLCFAGVAMYFQQLHAARKEAAAAEQAKKEKEEAARVAAAEVAAAAAAEAAETGETGSSANSEFPNERGQNSSVSAANTNSPSRPPRAPVRMSTPQGDFYVDANQMQYHDMYSPYNAQTGGSPGTNGQVYR